MQCSSDSIAGRWLVPLYPPSPERVGVNEGHVRAVKDRACQEGPGDREDEMDRLSIYDSCQSTDSEHGKAACTVTRRGPTGAAWAGFAGTRPPT